LSLRDSISPQSARNLAEAIARGGLQGGADDAKPEGKQGDLPLDKKPDAKPADDSAALRAELKAKEERLAKFEADAKKRADEEKAAADKKAIDEGKAKDLLAAREKELEAERARIAAFEKREELAAKEVFEALPDAEKEAAKLLEGKLSKADYADYLRSRAKVTQTITAPPAGTPGKSGSPRKLRELHPETKETLGELYAEPVVYRVGQHLDVEPTESGKKFTLSTKRFVAALRARSQMGNRDPWTAEAADKVLGAGG
jgi:hypothetical protein